MSSLIVQVRQIDDIKPHSNADRLEIIYIDGWQCVTQKGIHKVGDKVLYIPPDCCIPEQQAIEWGVNDYLGSGQRVKVVKLRGEPSYGCVIKLDKNYPIGTDLAEKYGITKWIPKTNNVAKNSPKGNIRETHPLWIRYTEIEHIKNFSKIIDHDTEIVVLEKADGCQQNIGILNGELVVGSRNLNRLPPGKRIRKRLPSIKWILNPKKWFDPYYLEFEVDEEGKKNCWFWFQSTQPEIMNLLNDFGKSYKQCILYTETLGIQKLDYGYKNELGYVAYDMAVDGKYLNWDEFKNICDQYNIKTVPVLYRGKYDWNKIKEVANQDSVICPNQMMEGGIIRPVVEQYHQKYGRIIFKIISDRYYLWKFGKDAPAELIEE